MEGQEAGAVLFAEFEVSHSASANFIMPATAFGIARDIPSPTP
jgi:hypothetical protein